jgi:hypothetical protein
MTPRTTDCPECNGTGEIEVPLGFCTGNPETDDWDIEDCPKCDGTGEVGNYDDE